MGAIDCQICLLIFVIASTEAAKRYDIHHQSKMEYGMTLDEVLHQFRRSEDYHKILERKKSELYELLNDIMFRTLELHTFKMGERIKDEFGFVDPEITEIKDETTSAPAHHSGKGLSKSFRLRHNRRDGAGGAGAESEHSDQDEHLKKVHRVDQYSLLHTALSAKERNKYRDMGFTVCGEIIHAVILGLGGVPGRPFADGSTLGLDENGKTEPTTEHSMNHIPTHGASADEDEDADAGAGAGARHTTPGAHAERPGTRL